MFGIILDILWTLCNTIISEDQKSKKDDVSAISLLTDSFRQLYIFLPGLLFCIPVGTKGESLLKSHLEVDSYLLKTLTEIWLQSKMRLLVPLFKILSSSICVPFLHSIQGMFI